MDRTIERLSNCSTQELRDIAEIIGKEIVRRNKEAEKTALLEFEKAFKKYIETNPNFYLHFDCEECGVCDDAKDGQEVLEQFFEEEKRKYFR